MRLTRATAKPKTVHSKTAPLKAEPPPSLCWGFLFSYVEKTPFVIVLFCYHPHVQGRPVVLLWSVS